jgi:hypothetical protein
MVKRKAIIFSDDSALDEAFNNLKSISLANIHLNKVYEQGVLAGGLLGLKSSENNIRMVINKGLQIVNNKIEMINELKAAHQQQNEYFKKLQVSTQNPYYTINDKGQKTFYRTMIHLKKGIKEQAESTGISNIQIPDDLFSQIKIGSGPKSFKFPAPSSSKDYTIFIAQNYDSKSPSDKQRYINQKLVKASDKGFDLLKNIIKTHKPPPPPRIISPATKMLKPPISPVGMLKQ